MALDKIGIAKRIAREVEDGFYVNLGIGIPTLVANFVREDIDVEFQSENGVLGMGPFPYEGEENADIINAGKQTITTLPGASFFDSATSFSMIRGQHVHLTILGAMEVAENGDIANWKIPGKMVKGMGGAMDLVAGAKRVIVIMTHCNKYGVSKVVPKCNLPITGEHCVNHLLTDYGWFDFVVDDDGNRSMILTEIASDVTVEDVKAVTPAEFTVSKNLKTISF